MGNLPDPSHMFVISDSFQAFHQEAIDIIIKDKSDVYKCYMLEFLLHLQTMLPQMNLSPTQNHLDEVVNNCERKK